MLQTQKANGKIVLLLPNSVHVISIRLQIISYKARRTLRHRYPTLETASQNSWPPSLDHPKAPRSHSAHARSFICDVAACGCTGRENAIFSNAMGDGVTSHQSISAGGEGKRSSGAGGLCSGGSSCEKN